MKLTIILVVLTILSCNNSQNSKMKTSTQNKEVKQNFIGGYSDVNGLKMYYEIYGQGNPLVLIHGGGSTIQTSFGGIISQFAKNRQIIAVELQAHGRTNDRNTDLTFEQDADDVAKLLENLHIPKADFLGFSNGGHTAIEIAIRHPNLVNKIILCSVFVNRNGAFPHFFEGFDGKVDFSNMPQAYKDEFLKINNNPKALLSMFNKDVHRMKNFKGWSDEQIKSIKVPTLVVNGNADVGTPEHAVEMFRLLPKAQLLILPGTHGSYINEINTRVANSKIPGLTVAIFEEFLTKKD
jgi:pimeloyl-ACP methyl ester carboxylesterase